MTADLVEARAKLGKLYGVILLPEGLIEFIPEVGECVEKESVSEGNSCISDHYMHFKIILMK